MKKVISLPKLKQFYKYKSNSKRGSVIVFVLIAVVILIGTGAYVVTSNPKNSKLSPNNQTVTTEQNNRNSSASTITIDSAKFIIASPIDLSEIKRISKYRSCVGHDSMAQNIDGEDEPIRSMKHYLDSGNFIVGSDKKIKAIAPFDGKIQMIIDEDFGGKNILMNSVNMPEGWFFTFFHTDLLPGLNENSTVKAGQVIGYQNPQVTYFDAAVRTFINKATNKPYTSQEMRKLMSDENMDPNSIGHIYTSMFEHMSDEVLAKYESYGITKENVMFTKAQRDNNPCKCEGGIPKLECDFFQDTATNAHWVNLK